MYALLPKKVNSNLIVEAGTVNEPEIVMSPACGDLRVAIVKDEPEGSEAVTSNPKVISDEVVYVRSRLAVTAYMDPTQRLDIV